MRIVQMIDSLIAGGKERQFCELARGLAAMPGIDVHVVVLSDLVQYDALAGAGIPVHTITRGGRGASVSDFVKVWRLVRKLKPDILHSWNSMCSVYAAPAARPSGAVFVNGFFRNAPTELSFDMRLRTALTLPWSDIAVSNSKAGIAAYRLPAGRSVCIYNGFDPERLAGLPPQEAVRQSLAITTPHIVGMVGAFRPDKDYRSFLDMAVSLTRARDDVTVVAVGDGPSLDAFRQAYPAAAFPRIMLLGRRTDAEAVTNIFTVGVLASYSEGISNAIMEYMALGKPVVATDIAGNRELVEEGRSGFLVPPNDPLVLQMRVVELLDDPALAHRLGAHGRARIAREFTFPAMIDAYVALYHRLIDGRAGRLGRYEAIRA